MNLTTARLVLEPMAPPHAQQLVQFFVRNEEHLRPWDPPRPRGITDVEFWDGEARRAVEDHAEGAVARWVLLLRGDPARIVGRVNFTQVVRGPFQSCMLGYAVDAQCQGQGLMHEALEAALGYAFEVMQLHRVQANHLPDNQRSARLLQRLGFRVEGLARDYLFINGAWRDHVLTALTYSGFDARIYRAAS